jgi:hypothetical protein
MKPVVIMVGADKGGVGKTTISRALLDHLHRNNVLARAFDTENPRGTLQRFYPNITEIIDLHNVADQMKVLDTLETAKVPVTIVDLKAGNLSYALDTFEKIGVLQAARDGMFEMGLIHVVGPAIASLDELQEVTSYVQGIDYIVARNFINETNFFEWDENTYQRYFQNVNEAREIEIPKLNEMAAEQVDLANVTYKNFVDNKDSDGKPANFSFVLRGYVKKWCDDLDAEFGQLRLVQMLTGGGDGGSKPAKSKK